jgi:sugar phosphate isomerase/epimerase
MTMGLDTELAAGYWTVSGPVKVHFGREWSLFDWADRCAEAAKVGFDGIGLWHADIEHQLETRSLEDMSRIFDDSGLKHLEVEFIADFFVEEGADARKESDRLRKLLFDTAAAMNAHHIKVGNIPGTPCELDRVTESYAELCADAARHTDAKILYEFMPFDVNVDSLDKALQLLEGAGADNGGVVIDTWHMAKLGIAPDELRRIPVKYLGWIELSDGKFDWSEDRLDEVINHRNVPGEGEFDIQGYVDACRDHGYPGPWGVEVLSEELRNNPIDVIFKRGYDSTAAFVGGVKGGV